MSFTKGIWTDQKILFAVGLNDGLSVILGYTQNATTEERLIFRDNHADEILHEYSKKIQKLNPGIYLWEGDIEWNTAGEEGGIVFEKDDRFYGKVRPSKITDLVNFGLIALLPVQSVSDIMEKEIVSK